jgi:predicted transglutaminase-like cysteine proteinase
MGQGTLCRLVLAAVLAAVSLPARAQPLDLFMDLGAVVPPPPAWLDFCEREPLECPRAAPGVSPEAAGARLRSSYWRLLFTPAKVSTAPAPNALTDGDLATLPRATRGVMRQLDQVNRQINRSLIPRADADEYGADDYWALPLETGQRYGDCEDYVLEKRHALEALGYPQRALSIAFVESGRLKRHAVLLVSTDAGEMVLDSLSPWVVPWRQAGYVWLERQSFARPDLWVAGPGQRPG